MMIKKKRKLKKLKLEIKKEDDIMNNIKTDDFEISETGIKLVANTPNLKDQPEIEEIKLSKDDYEIDHKLGEGAGGTVFKAKYLPTEEIQALKVITFLRDMKMKNLIIEMNTMMNCDDCPYIIKCFGAYYDKPKIYMAMELMDLGTLDNLYCEGQTLPEPILGQISYQVLKGLYYLHKKARVIHRDIKPSNLLVNSQGEVKISDFGVSGTFEFTNQMKSTWAGTKLYMSPERFGGGEHTSNTDIWSFGLTILECCLGRFPYNEEGRSMKFWDYMNLVKEGPPPKIPDELSEEFKDFILLCLQKSPKERPSAKTLLSHPFIGKYKKMNMEAFSNVMKKQYLIVKKVREDQEEEED